MGIGRAYFNNGLSFRTSDGSDLAAGEVFFDNADALNPPTAAQLSAVFPDYEAALAAAQTPVYTCQLWQLQSVMTAEQWSAAQTAVANLSNPAVSAFWAHGTNNIPSNSTTLLQLGEAIGLTADQITSLIQQASGVAIP